MPPEPCEFVRLYINYDYRMDVVIQYINKVMSDRNILLFTLVLATMIFGAKYLSHLSLRGSDHTIKTNSVPKNPIIYEISLRPWLYELSKKYDKQIQRLNDIPVEEFTHLKSIGVDYVWLMGIWKLGQYGVEFDRKQTENIKYYKTIIPDFTMDDIIGSPYAISEFICNPELGTDDDILALKRKLNSLGLKLMLDFVPNHSAVDSPYTSSHPEYYIRAPQGQSPPYDSEIYLPNGISYGSDLYDGAWKDTAQWNYWNNDARKYLKSVVMKIASLSDGMRCDMAMVILNDLFYQKWKTQLDSWGYRKPSQEFWKEAIQETKAKYPDTIFLAEVYWNKEQDLIDTGFDFVYEKELLDTLATEDIGKVKLITNNLNQNYAAHSNHFVENHDEPRAIQKFGGKDYIANVAAIVSYTLPGAKFINHGQLQGYANKLDVHLRRSASEKGSDYSKWFYTQLMKVISLPAFHENSQWFQVKVNGNDAWRFLAWRVTNGQQKVLVVVNYSDTKAYTQVVVPDAGTGQVQIFEMFSEVSYNRDGATMADQNNGLAVIIDAWNTQVFKY